MRSSITEDGVTTTRVSLVGTVRAGVEPGCRVLTAAGTTYQLIGGDRSLLQPGTRVRVHGTPAPEQPTTCLHPHPLRVLHAAPA